MTELVDEFPKRWSEPFSNQMDNEQVEYLLEKMSFIDPKRFPNSLPLHGIFKNDCRLRSFKPGDIIIREGDYGGNAFYVFEGEVCVVRKPGLPEAMLGRTTIKKKNAFFAFSQLFSKNITEYRGKDVAHGDYLHPDQETVNLYDSPMADKVFQGPNHPITNKPHLSSKYHAISLQPGIWLGEIAALARVPRTATVFAQTDVKVMEIRWQGLRDIRIYDADIREKIDAGYRSSLLKTILSSSPYFAHIQDDKQLNEIAYQAVFESHGDFEWSQSYKDAREQGNELDTESIIVHEGDYADCAFIVAGGFGRISVRYGQGHRTLNYLKSGDVFGIYELYDTWKNSDRQTHPSFQTTLSTLGYLQVLRIPAKIIHSHVFSKDFSYHELNLKALNDFSVAENALLEWAIEKRLINGTQVMLIDQERCVRCDDCVRACANGHDKNPRFIRHGHQFANWMITNACMHCDDPVCMIGCPTGAIHRLVDGTVVINDEYCIGCSHCAHSCPYHNIRMVEIHDAKGQLIMDEKSQEPRLKATKCDLCASLPGGPACVRACPHDALKRIDFQNLMSLS